MRKKAIWLPEAFHNAFHHLTAITDVNSTENYGLDLWLRMSLKPLTFYSALSRIDTEKNKDLELDLSGWIYRIRNECTNDTYIV